MRPPAIAIHRRPSTRSLGCCERQVFSLKEIVDFYIQKYFDGSEFMVLKSLTYFEDADGQPSPQMFLDFDWEKCKKTILEEVKRL